MGDIALIDNIKATSTKSAKAETAYYVSAIAIIAIPFSPPIIVPSSPAIPPSPSRVMHTIGTSSPNLSPSLPLKLSPLNPNMLKIDILQLLLPPRPILLETCILHLLSHWFIKISHFSCNICLVDFCSGIRIYAKILKLLEQILEYVRLSVKF